MASTLSVNQETVAEDFAAAQFSELQIQDNVLVPVTQISLLGLPAELHINLFELLDKDTSTCLGLTCTPFYAIHRNMHVDENTMSAADREKYPNSYRFQDLDILSLQAWIARDNGSQMPRLLKEFMGPELVFEARITCLFVTRARHEALTEKYRRFHAVFDANLKQNYPIQEKRDREIRKICKSLSRSMGVENFIHGSTFFGTLDKTG